jgi:hypothetical protein
LYKHGLEKQEVEVNCKIAELMLGVKLARRCCQDLAAEAGAPEKTRYLLCE